MQGHEKVLEKLPSRVAAMVPNEDFLHAIQTAGLRPSEPRFINFAHLAAFEALQVPHLMLTLPCICPTLQQALKCTPDIGSILCARMLSGHHLARQRGRQQGSQLAQA